MTLLLCLKKQTKKTWEQAYYSMDRIYDRLVSAYENYKCSEEPCVWTLETHRLVVYGAALVDGALFSILDGFKYGVVNIASCVVCD